MIKKDYIKPAMKVVQLQHHAHILAGSLRGVSTSGLGDDGIGYDENGGNQGNAWSRGSNGWDDDEEEDW
jgi:hypothetical protein